jgi:hypothetical protein
MNVSLLSPRGRALVDWERIFVLNERNEILGEYALNDDSPVEVSDLTRSIPVSGMKHLVSFYQGEYAFTPFRVDDLWFVLLTRGVPRIEERGSIGTLLAAARVHIPPAIDPVLARRERDVADREQVVREREKQVVEREDRVSMLEFELETSTARLQEFETSLNVREEKLDALRDYAVEMQRSFVQPRPPKGRDPADNEPALPRE